MTGFPTQVRKFLSENSLATIATISKDTDCPYEIPVYYVAIDDSLYFASHKESKTLRNILSHPHMSISITNHSDLIQCQLQGTSMAGEQKSENNMAPILPIP